jgi:hypothetical protein
MRIAVGRIGHHSVKGGTLLGVQALMGQHRVPQAHGIVPTLAVLVMVHHATQAVDAVAPDTHGGYAIGYVSVNRRRNGQQKT